MADFGTSDMDLVVFLSSTGPCSLDRSPGSNWVQKDGGLPNYICHIASALNRAGRPVSQSIAIAVSRTKAWAAGGTINGHEVHKDTQAKAAAAVAEWEALKAKAKGKKLVKATHEDGTEYIMLSNIPSFSLDNVRTAWNEQQREQRVAAAKKNPKAATAAAQAAIDYPPAVPYAWVKEVWTDFIIITMDESTGEQLYKVPYTVDANNDVTFAEGQPVKTVYVVDAGEDLTDEEKTLLGLDGNSMFLTHERDALESILKLSRKQ